MPRTDSRKKFVIFDFGGVLIDWDPKHLYRKLLPDEESIEQFLTTICRSLLFRIGENR